MSKPITNAPTAPLSFEQRLTLVKGEVRARTAAYPAHRQNHIRACCWVKWINRNVLEVSA